MILHYTFMMIVTLLLVLVAFSPFTNAATARYSFAKTNPHPNAKYFDNSRIIGGVDAPAGFGEHMVSLVYGHQWMLFICGGSIVAPRTILTAAHCIDSMRTWDGALLETFRAKIASYRWATGEDREFSGYVVHPGWDWDTIKNDIGILRVSRDMRPSNRVSIMPISFKHVGGGLRCYVTGWGLREDMESTPNLLQVLQNIISLTHEDCQRRMREATKPGEFIPAIARNEMICGLHSYGHGMCNGDSGSGLIDMREKKLVALVSWGIPCGKGAPDVYTRMSTYEDWLAGVGIW